MARLRRNKNRDPEPVRSRGRRAPIIELSEMTKVYPGGHMALDRVNLAIGRGEFVFLVGPTGCGKSTLIKMLIRELDATEGSVRIAGRDIGCRRRKSPSCAATSAPSSRTSSCSPTGRSTTTSPTPCR